MEKSIITVAIFFIFIAFVGLPALQAQQADVIATASYSQNTPLLRYTTSSTHEADSEKKPNTLNVAAGQQTAYFNNLEGYLEDNLIYPRAAQENGIEGRVIVLAEISIDGKIIAATIIESIGFGCDEAALSVVQNMPAWTPAMNYGVPVRGKKAIEFNFRLQ